jgi:hypothetical protein
MFLPQSLLDCFPAELRAAFRVFSLRGRVTVWEAVKTLTFFAAGNLLDLLQNSDGLLRQRNKVLASATNIYLAMEERRAQVRAKASAESAIGLSEMPPECVSFPHNSAPCL